MGTDSILELRNLSKTFILGNRKNAVKAQKVIQKVVDRYEDLLEKGETQRARVLEKVLQKAQDLFTKEEFEEAYRVITGKKIKARRRDRGTVVHALNGVSLEIKKGDLVAVVGPSGSGKSTLLNMLGLLDSPTSGRVFLEGRNVTTIKRRELPDIRSRQLGFVFQSFNLISTMTALENVMLPLKYAKAGKRKRKDMARAALEQVGLGNRLNHTPNELSGGQQQRVAIARSIVNNPAIIFGDELTGELDSKMTKEIMDLITELNRGGQTFVIVTHNSDVANRCKRIIHMKDGKIEKESISKLTK